MSTIGDKPAAELEQVKIDAEKDKCLNFNSLPLTQPVNIDIPASLAVDCSQPSQNEAQPSQVKATLEKDAEDVPKLEKKKSLSDFLL